MYLQKFAVVVWTIVKFGIVKPLVWIWNQLLGDNPCFDDYCEKEALGLFDTEID